METVCKLAYKIVTLLTKSQAGPFISLIKGKVVRQFWVWDPKLEMLTGSECIEHAEGLLSWKSMLPDLTFFDVSAWCPTCAHAPTFRGRVKEGLACMTWHCTSDGKTTILYMAV